MGGDRGGRGAGGPDPPPRENNKLSFKERSGSVV